MSITPPPGIRSQSSADLQSESDSFIGEASGTCQLGGQTFNERDIVCWEGVEYICQGGNWVKTGKAC